MSTLNYREKRYLEDLLGMSSGYVLNFSDREFAELFEEVAGIEIHSEKYSTEGSSKANKLRSFWKIESDYVVGRVLLELNERDVELFEKNPDLPILTKAVLKELRLVPEGVPNEARGRDVHKRILSNMATIGNGIAELRGLYGTGHGQDGRATGLTSSSPTTQI